MLQTSSSAPVLAALSLDSPPKAGPDGASGGSEAFSQELDSQVKNINSREPAKDGAGPRPETQGDEHECAVGGDAASAEEQDVQASTDGDEVAATLEEPGGKDLPLEQLRKLSAEAQQLLATRNESGVTSDETNSAPLAEGADTESVMADEVSLTLDDTVPADPIEMQPEVDIRTLVSGEEPVTLQPVQAPITMEGVAVSPDGDVDEDVALSSRSGSGALNAVMRPVIDEGQGRDAVRQVAAREAGMTPNLQGLGRGTALPIDTTTPNAPPLPGQGASNPLAAPAVISMSLSTPMHQANWGQGMAERVMWMANAKIQEAEIQLHPRELGPIGIKVSVSHDQANVSFVAQHAATRDALESAIPRLREMLSESGLQLGNADVSTRDQRGDGERPQATGGSSLHGDDAVEGDDALPSSEVSRGIGYVSPSGVDAFA